MIQDYLALGSVAVAGMFLLSKLVIQPILKKNGPDVPAANLVRGRRSPAKKSGCH